MNRVMSILVDFLIGAGTAVAILSVTLMVDQSESLRGFGPMTAIIGGALFRNQLLGIR